MKRPFLLTAYHALCMTVPIAWRMVATSVHKKQDAPAARLRERFGDAAIPRPEGPLIWIHAESVGEVRGAAQLMPALAANAHVLITTNTQTGAERVKAFEEPVTHQFKPIDTPAATRAFLDHWQPDIAIFLESDMPPTMLGALCKREIPKALIAARPSKTRAQAPKTAGALLSQFDLITASSQMVADAIENLGAKVSVVEDLKALGAAPAEALDWPEQQIARPLWLAVSTHPEEHTLLFAAHEAIMAERPDALLAIAPRHPQPSRAWAPARLSPVFFSDGTPPKATTHLFVMDAFGRLPSLHAMSHVSYIGGALASRGGHSPWEAASAGSVIITGPDTANNAPAYAQLPHHTITSADELAKAVLTGLDAPRPAPIRPEATAGKTANAVLALLPKDQ